MAASSLVRRIQKRRSGLPPLQNDDELTVARTCSPATTSFSASLVASPNARKGGAPERRLRRRWRRARKNSNAARSAVANLPELGSSRAGFGRCLGRNLRIGARGRRDRSSVGRGAGPAATTLSPSPNATNGATRATRRRAGVTGFGRRVGGVFQPALPPPAPGGRVPTRRTRLPCEASAPRSRP
jgi:hypothetical protein